MNDDWDIADILAERNDEEPRHRGKPFNKERFCKKNRIGNGQYGPHTYMNGNCTLCNKIDPRIKFRPGRTEEQQ